ncbi:PREDICTED: uncharacterized PE-PGRS family protein PE_PGRS10-like, partial [Theobroma cacao]|uniref:Uncharacterized PE-PGRS family protein PE_PGRS10-like n=1 Tax=Theobroma cacao TaxID=3641 RepID=A0AB32WRB0_THECC
LKVLNHTKAKTHNPNSLYQGAQTEHFHQGLVFAGGGEKNGMDGIVVGMVGIEGMLGRGGRVILGVLGMVGKVGMLGRGGRVPGLGRDGWVVGNVGVVGCGRFGIDGNGGSVALGKVGIGGKGGIWRR